MSKVVFLGFPGYGHVNPTLGVVKELVSRGEKVLYFATPQFEPGIRGAGADFCDYRISGNDPKDFLLPKMKLETLNQSGREAFGRMEFYFKIMNHPKINLAKIISDYNPDYLIHDSCANWGKTLGKELRLPTLNSMVVFAYCDKLLELHPDFVLRNFLGIPNGCGNDPGKARKIIARLNSMMSSLFDIPDYDLFDVAYSQEALNIVYTSKEFQFFAEEFDSSFQFVGPSLNLPNNSTAPGLGAPEKAAGLYPMFPAGSASKRLIYISLGTVETNNPLYPDFYQKCFAAFGADDQPVFLASGKMKLDQLGPIPANFIIEPYLPQLDILKRAALFVTHGGMNSVNEALYYNVPMIVIPQRVDQFMVAERLVKLGAAIKLNMKEFSARDLAEAAAEIFGAESYRKRCGVIGASLRATGGAKQAVDEIFKFKAKQGINP